MYVNVFRLPIYNKKPDELTKALINAKEKRVGELTTTGLSENHAKYLYIFILFILKINGDLITI